MTQFPKFLPVNLISIGLLALISCQEGTSKKPNPNPTTPPLNIKVSGPEGFRQGDSASFRRIMNGEMDPDTLHSAKPATPKHKS